MQAINHSPSKRLRVEAQFSDVNVDGANDKKIPIIISKLVVNLGVLYINMNCRYTINANANKVIIVIEFEGLPIRKIVGIAPLIRNLIFTLKTPINFTRCWLG